MWIVSILLVRKWEQRLERLPGALGEDLAAWELHSAAQAGAGQVASGVGAARAEGSTWA